MICKSALAIALSLFPSAVLCQTEGGTLPAGTPLALRIDDHLPMRKGQPIRAHLLYPIYANDKLLLPEDTVVTGSVVDLRSDHSRRVRATMGGDFTPFHKPVVHFTSIILADGTSIPFASDDATDGAPIFRAIATPPAKGGLLHRQFSGLLTVVRSDIAIVTGPEKADRFVQFIYSQIPYHPERIDKGTTWTIETSQSVDVPAEPAPPVVAAADPQKRHFWEEPAPIAEPARADAGWIVQANLDESISSETSKDGQVIKATVAEPIFNPDHTIAVPQGSTLIGTITRAKPSRKFGRTGVLTFNFRQLQIPDAETRIVETRLTGADSARDIALNSEGQAKSKPQDKISLPFLLVLMASRPLDQDHHDSAAGGGNTLGKNAVGGAAGLGLVGTVLGLSGISPNAAAGIGYYGAARAFYYRWIAHGQKIDFAKNTRIVVETTPRSSAPMKP
jgi:hypothetical protein